jgi:hypothetical protein
MESSLIVPPQSPNKNRIRIMSQHGGLVVLAPTPTLSNGTTQVSGSDRFKFIPNTDVKNLEFIFFNGYTSGNSIGNPGNALKFRAVLENINALIPIPLTGSTGLPISTGSGSGCFIGDGELMHCKPIQAQQMLNGSSQFYIIYKIEPLAKL